MFVHTNKMKDFLLKDYWVSFFSMKHNNRVMRTQCLLFTIWPVALLLKIAINGNIPMEGCIISFTLRIGQLIQMTAYFFDP